ncbi:MAG: hypothetical protein JW940_15915 [Polyangiaceae bacterium]|nr:hypothetical protein [Polyangiaceae bacterium]
MGDGTDSPTGGPDHEVTGSSYWKAIEHRRARGIGAAVVMLIAVLAGAFALQSGGSQGDDGASEATRTIIPAEETTSGGSTLTPDAGAIAAGSDTGAGDQAGDAITSGGEAAALPGRAALVAYRRNGWLCVSAEDGTGELSVAECSTGVFSLSPDGTTIACADAASGMLVLFHVGGAVATPVGPALQDTPVWSPDSAWFAYTAPGPKVMRTDRTGSGQTELMAGRMPNVSPDGSVVAAVSPDASPPAVLVWRAGSVRSRVMATAVSGVACSDSRIYYGLGPDAAGAVELRSMTLDRTGDRVEVEAPEATRAVSFGPACVSPDGVWVAYAERSDDGYSRTFALPTAGGDPVSLSIRRDCYPLCWSANGQALFFVEGNAIQGDPTSLGSVTPADGLRRMLVTGAGL